MRKSSWNLEESIAGSLRIRLQTCRRSEWSYGASPFWIDTRWWCRILMRLFNIFMALCIPVKWDANYVAAKLPSEGLICATWSTDIRSGSTVCQMGCHCRCACSQYVPSLKGNASRFCWYQLHNWEYHFKCSTILAQFIIDPTLYCKILTIDFTCRNYLGSHWTECVAAFAQEPLQKINQFTAKWLDATVCTMQNLHKTLLILIQVSYFLAWAVLGIDSA